MLRYDEFSSLLGFWFTDVLVDVTSEAIFEVPSRVACEVAVDISETNFEVPKVGGHEALP